MAVPGRAATNFAGSSDGTIAISITDDAANDQTNIVLSASGGGGSTIIVKDEGSSLGSFNAANFVGAGVTATNGGGGTATITIPGASGGVDVDHDASPVGTAATLNFQGTSVDPSVFGGGRIDVPIFGAANPYIDSPVTGSASPQTNVTMIPVHTATAATITLPVITAGIGTEVHVVFDIDGTAGSNNITIQGSGGAMINGAATATINQNYGALAFVVQGSNWFVYSTTQSSGGGTSFPNPDAGPSFTNTINGAPGLANASGTGWTTIFVPNGSVQARGFTKAITTETNFYARWKTTQLADTTISGATSGGGIWLRRSGSTTVFTVTDEMGSSSQIAELAALYFTADGASIVSGRALRQDDLSGFVRRIELNAGNINVYLGYVIAGDFTGPWRLVHTISAATALGGAPDQWGICGFVDGADVFATFDVLTAA